MLSEVSGYDELYLYPDRTHSERVAHRKLVEAMKKKREDEPEKVHFIRNNRVVTREKRAEEWLYIYDYHIIWLIDIDFMLTGPVICGSGILLFNSVFLVTRHFLYTVLGILDSYFGLLGS